MRDPWDDAELRRRFLASADASERRAPLNAALCRIAAADRSLWSLLAHAPESQRLPVLMLNSVHHELLADPSAELAAWYPNLSDAARSPDDPELADVFARFVEERAPTILASIAERHTQTNEVGRTALLVAGLGDLDPMLGGRPIAHLDVGTSAGLNLLLGRLRYRFTFDDGTEHLIDPPAGVDSPIEITASVRGRTPLPSTMPVVGARRGLDLRPIDLDDDDSRRWLEACVWPDQADRFERLRAAIDLARSDPPEIAVGDAVTDLPFHLGGLRDSGVPVVTTTWVLNYLSTDQRRAFVAALDGVGERHDLVWVFAEAPALTPGLPHRHDQLDDHRTAVTRVTWFGGERHVTHVGVGHPHGYWIHTT